LRTGLLAVRSTPPPHLGALPRHHHRAATGDPVPSRAARRDREMAFGRGAFHAHQDGAAARNGYGFHCENAEATAEELGHGRVPIDSLFRIMRDRESGTQRESCTVHHYLQAGHNLQILRLIGPPGGAL
jgi:hypothetical protein